MSASAASRAQPGRNNVLEAGDFPIVLGDSLKKDAARSKFLRLRYNWTPQSGFSHLDGNLKRTNGQVQLGYRNKKNTASTYDYTAVTPKDADNQAHDDSKTEQFALVFDPSKSVYVLEQITQSFDLNLTSAHDQSGDEIRKHKQISTYATKNETISTNGVDGSAEDDDDQADPKNPFDFRHFLSEAKENAEKAAHPPGNRTPVPGGRTPMSGISSPSLGAAGRFLSNTTQFRSTPISAPLPKKPASVKPTTSVPSKKQNITKKKAVAAKPAPTKPLSSEIVSSSSDEEVQDTATTKQLPKSRPRDKSHVRNASSASIEPSSHVVVNDGGLDIDYGSPPPEARRRAILDIGAFRSQTQTPTLGQSSNKPSMEHSRQDIEMRDQSDDDDEDDYDVNNEVQNATDIDMDDDVEELALDSPRVKKDYARREDIEKVPSPPTPLPPPADDDEEEEDFLANELLAEMMGQGDDDNEALANVVDDDESEVSEEE